MGFSNRAAGSKISTSAKAAQNCVCVVLPKIPRTLLQTQQTKNLTGLQDPEASHSLLSVIRKLRGILPKESQVRILTEGTYRGKRRCTSSRKRWVQQRWKKQRIWWSPRKL
ncbi:hypothetical protein J1N35_030054 [Gossypium stocksii]|uniref:Uncharacterized protein n=1 Tax=Gossypium stocksii TaxID=47602 RepID=A0A9D3UZV6_9ROSI|nr:hypothetical protein J1N35_030054 [Gossypium stocksii]